MSSEVKAGPWRGQPLPRGRHHLDATQVRASQRERLLRAMLETVGARGYQATTVPQVVAAARVSRNAFYEFFTDKTDCFIAVCDEQARDLLQQVLAHAAEPDWTDAVRRGTHSYLQWWQERPAFSRAYFLELPRAGDRALEQRERGYALFRGMFAELGLRARDERGAVGPLPEIVPRVLVLAITELVAEEVRAGRQQRLTDLEDDLVALIAKLLGV